jgi:cell wall-associated NlpC family hydrolase
VATTTTARERRVRMARIVAPLAALAVVLSGVVLSGAPASAAPTKTIEQVQAEIDALEQDAANAAEAWNEARVRQVAIERKISTLTVRIAAAKAAYGRVSGAIDDMARAAYATGGIEPSLQALLAEDPQSFLDQSAALDQVARSQGTSLRRTASARLALAQLEAQLTQQQTAATAASADAAAQKKLVREKIAQAEAVLASLKAEERRALEALATARRAASAKAAREAADRASREARRKAAARATTSTTSGSSDSGEGGGGGRGSGGGNGGNDNGGSPSPGDGSSSSRARIAVAYALAQVGDRYVAAADGPNSFDCSGLTLAAWRKAGVSLPHYSYSQYSATRRISRSELRPGDLLFYFGGSAHHVAMYIGGGMMVSASNPRDGVEVIAAWGPWYGSRYSGAGRVA